MSGGNPPTSPFGHKLRPRHLDRLAVVYVRQSTPQQVADNRESADRQYALADRAVALGWAEDRVLVIDDDQGESGHPSRTGPGSSGCWPRSSLGHVGLVFGREMSRLARSCKDWHQLLELCGLLPGPAGRRRRGVRPDRRQRPAPARAAGMMSEAELHVLKARMHQGKLNKARRGELFTCVPIGYVRIARRRDRPRPGRAGAVASSSLVFDQVRRTRLADEGRTPTSWRTTSGSACGCTRGRARDDWCGSGRGGAPSTRCSGTRSTPGPTPTAAARSTRRAGRRASEVRPAERPARGVGVPAPGQGAGVHHVGAVRGEPAAAGRRTTGGAGSTERDRPRADPAQRHGPVRPVRPADGARATRALTANPRYACDCASSGVRRAAVPEPGGRVPGPADRVAGAAGGRAGGAGVEPAGGRAGRSKTASGCTRTGGSGWSGPRTRRAGRGGSTTRSIPENRLVARELERQWEQKLAEQRRLEEDYARFQAEQPRHLSGGRPGADPGAGGRPAGAVAGRDDDGRRTGGPSCGC